MDNSQLSTLNSQLNKPIICGMQQMGIGVANVEEAFKWYIKAFGCDIKILDDEGVAERMLPYTGGKPQPRRAILAVNLRGGGGFEIWQPKGRELKYLSEKPQIGDIGIFSCKIKSADIQRSFSHFKQLSEAKIVGEICNNPNGKKHFFMYDPYDNLFDIEEDDYVFAKTDAPTGGANGAIVGVSDMDKSIKFYAQLLGYDTIEYDKTDFFDDLKSIPGGDNRIRRVMIKPSAPLQGPLCEIMGTSHIELVQIFDKQPIKLYEDRWWGDPGFIHLCFDIRNMQSIKKIAESLGHPFVCDSGTDFQMGEADGHFTYVEDPDGTLIEFVETFKIPILKKFGIYLHLKNKDDRKPLPHYITKALRFLRVKE